MLGAPRRFALHDEAGVQPIEARRGGAEESRRTGSDSVGCAPRDYAPATGYVAPLRPSAPAQRQANPGSERMTGTTTTSSPRLPCRLGSPYGGPQGLISSGGRGTRLQEPAVRFEDGFSDTVAWYGDTRPGGRRSAPATTAPTRAPVRPRPQLGAAQERAGGRSGPRRP